MPPLFFLLLSLLLLPSAAEGPPADGARLEAAKNVGLAALEEGNLEEAGRRFEEVRRLAPKEPMGWANGAVAALRAKNLSDAKRLLAEALKRAPEDPRVLAIEAARRELAGDAAGAAAAFEKAATLDPKDLVSRWSAARIARELPDGRRRALSSVETGLERSPANLFLLLRLSELAREEGDRARAEAVHERIARAADADPRVAKHLEEALAALRSGDARAASLKYRIVENLLRASPLYQQARNEVEPGVVGFPLEDWSPALAGRLRAGPAARVPVTFVQAPSPGFAALANLRAVRAGGRDARDLAFAGEDGIVLAAAERGGFRAGPPRTPGARRLKVADVTNSGELDLVSPGTLRLGKSGRAVPLPEGDDVALLDFDSDGDLDLYLSARSGDRLLRNNLDGTFTDVTSASGLPKGLASGAAAADDFDRDGDVDLVVAVARRDGGGLLLLDNLRGGRFEAEAAGLPGSGAVEAIAAGDLDGDGEPDLVWSGEGGVLTAVHAGGNGFAPARPVSAEGAPHLFDFDNDGALDLFLASEASPSTLWRNDGRGVFASAQAGSFPAARGAAPVDFDGDGDLDLALVTAAGRAALFENRGGNANGWLEVTLEGLATGSAKVNRFGYGSQVELKAQDLYVSRTVELPVTHLGLGPRRKADVLRVLWTNGVPQNRVNPPTRTVLKEVQQLKGSCPFLYAFDGKRWRFVTDVLGNSPVGLLYDGVHQAPADTREWLVLSGDLLSPAQGTLRLDFTEELWETAYFDLAELRAVDHPEGTEIVSNERMVPPPFPPEKLHTVSRPIVPRALDEKGRDRTREIARQDGDFLGGFTPTRYQGIVALHDLVLELPRARQARRVMLYLTGWIFYADTSINVSLSQGKKPDRPFGPVLEVPDGKGGWKAAMAPMGFPAGKTKTMPLDLSGVLDRRDPRVRIRTNLEIYWDRIVYTVDEEDAPLVVTGAPLTSARLFFRGFSRMVRETREGPHVFLHDDVDTTPRWADMKGLYTRFGDVGELLRAADDRYVVMKGGDCVRLEFDARGLPPIPPGWKRDYVIVLDGWEKDADENTIAAQTVEPLPFHGQDDARYGEPQPFPDGEAHREFRRHWLTRPGGPEELRDLLREPAR